METFALFADGDCGSASRIVLGFYEADSLSSDSHPVTAKSINIEDQEVRHSAVDGFHSAFHSLHTQNLVRGQFCFTYQLAEQPKTYFGKSAGLAFCLKFVQEVYISKRGGTLDFNIAATGELSDATEKSQVKRVEGISSKVRAALSVLNKGDKVLYPNDNANEIEPDIKQDALEKGIELIQCSSIRQAIQILIELFRSEPFPSEPYPIEIAGIGDPPNGIGAYRVLKRSWFGFKMTIPFSIINKGNLAVKVTSSTNESDAKWIKLSFDDILVQPNQSLQARISLPNENNLLYLLMIPCMPFLSKQVRFSLNFHIPEKQPYVLSSNIDINARIVNLPFAALIAIVVAWLSIIHFLPNIFATSPPATAIITKNGLDEMVVKLENGKYVEVRDSLKKHLEKSPTDRESLKLYEQLNQELNVKINFLYSSNKNQNSDNKAIDSIDKQKGMVLNSGDSYRFEVVPGSECYFYVFQQDASNKITVLFPRHDIPALENPLQANKRYFIPSGDSRFWLDDNLGQETFIFFATRWRARDLEDTIEAYSEIPNKSNNSINKQMLIDKIATRKNIQLAGMGGSFYKEFSFLHR
jgi:hypothetical protein